MSANVNSDKFACRKSRVVHVAAAGSRDDLIFASDCLSPVPGTGLEFQLTRCRVRKKLVTVHAHVSPPKKKKKEKKKRQREAALISNATAMLRMLYFYQNITIYCMKDELRVDIEIPKFPCIGYFNAA